MRRNCLTCSSNSVGIGRTSGGGRPQLGFPRLRVRAAGIAIGPDHTPGRHQHLHGPHRPQRAEPNRIPFCAKRRSVLSEYSRRSACSSPDHKGSSQPQNRSLTVNDRVVNAKSQLQPRQHSTGAGSTALFRRRIRIARWIREGSALRVPSPGSVQSAPMTLGYPEISTHMGGYSHSILRAFRRTTISKPNEFLGKELSNKRSRDALLAAHFISPHM